MKRYLLCATACLSLAGCAATGTGVTPAPSPAPAPAPLAGTQIDDAAIVLAFEALDAAATAVDGGIAHGWIVPGTPRAHTIALGLNGARNWMNAASSAQRAGQASDYATAIAQASAALAGVRRALNEGI